ncbi:MAG TPA: hypothetical protein VJV78_37855 [Polyangiales bacterium]|nr:hypothetical protein [Polyangiales bacterium]
MLAAACSADPKDSGPSAGAGGEVAGEGAGEGGASGDTAGGSGGGAGRAGGAAGASGSAGSAGAEAVSSIEIEPGSTTLEASGSTPETLQLVARARPSGDVITPVWTLDNTIPGSIDGAGLFTTSNTAGGVIKVSAAYQGLTATATITVHYSVEITSGTVPSSAGTLFDPAGKTVVTTAGDAPSLVYPVNDTMFPQNLHRVLFQWRGKGKPLFQLEFSSPVLKAAAYTDGVHATCTQAQTGGSCWESSVASWTALAGSNAGQTVTLKIRAVDSVSAPTTIYESPAYQLHFSQKDVPGAIYYWSTTVAGVRRGTMGDAGPTNFLTPSESSGKCVACHTLSKNGKLLAADIGGEKLGVVQVSATVPPPVNFGPTGTPATSYASSWATFDPDARYVVQSKGGVMTLRDAVTGTSLGPNNGIVPLGANTYAVQPDWALDGKHMAFASSASGKNATKDRAGGPVLQWIPTAIADGAVVYGSVETLQPSMSNNLYGYPMFNPTSEYISFVRGKAIEKDLTDQIWLMKAATGGAAMVNLTRANTLVSDSKAPAAGVENNMPTWAPTPGPDVQWIAFASKRDYGFVLCSPSGTTTSACATTSKIGSGKQQIWIAAIDVAKLGTSDEPSYPAFRVPFMELTEDCHRPFWALDALKEETGGAGGAGAGGAGAGGAGSGGMGGAGAGGAGSGGAGAGGSPACVDYQGDCSSGLCCEGFECTPNSDGTEFSCQVPPQ